MEPQSSVSPKKEPPPPYQSRCTTPSDLARCTRREEKEDPEFRLRWSRPAHQFHQQCVILEQRLERYLEVDEAARKLRPRFRVDTENVERLYNINFKLTIKENARQIVKSQWIQGGIWNPSWDKTNTFDKWAHEEPTTNLSIDHNASRPPHQFLRQVAEELRWLEGAGDWRDWYKPWLSPEAALLEMSTRTGRDTYHPANLQETAQENVRRSWILNKIWDPEWEYFPSNEWRHEGLHPALCYRRYECGRNTCPLLSPAEIPPFPQRWGFGMEI